jgi:hypothetical protein
VFLLFVVLTFLGESFAGSGHKCLTPGHFIYDCPNDWVCRKCHESGHKMMDCSKDFNESLTVG